MIVHPMIIGELNKIMEGMWHPWTSKELDNSLRSGRMIDGFSIWKLEDTYGYPLDLAIVTAKEMGRTINLRNYAMAKAVRRILSRISHGIVRGTQ